MLNKLLIRDSCRSNLNKYILKAFSLIPPINNPLILDMGCGTGVSALALMEICNGIFYELDTDKEALEWLYNKAVEKKCTERINIINATLFDEIKFENKFDIILAEGILNVIGFEYGLSIILNNIRDEGYIILHDELKDDAEKRKVFSNHKLLLIDSFVLDKKIWWDEYFHPLEKFINESEDKEIFTYETKEIEEYKENPSRNISVFYILKKII